MKVYKCRICGNVVDLFEVGGGQMVCCEQPMEELVAHEENEGLEKHLPVIEVDGNNVKVTVGSVLHPMETNHYITKIFLTYNDKVVRKALKPGEEPVANFVVDEEFSTLSAYEYCNLHDLWKTTYTK